MVLRLLLYASLTALLIAESGCRPKHDTTPPHNARSAAEKEIASEERYQWNLQTLVGDYGRTGKKDPKWDAEAREALKLFAKIRNRSRDTSFAEQGDQISNHVARAISAGCDDPLILYLEARFVHPVDPEEGDDLRKPIRPFVEAADGILEGDYSPIRKFYASVRAAEWYGRNAKKEQVRAEAPKFRQLSVTHLMTVVTDENTPGVEAAEAVHQFAVSPRVSPKWKHEAMTRIEPVLLKNWPDEPEVFLTLGNYYRNYAWVARGSGWASTVTEEGWRLFAERLKQAETFLTRAWQLDGMDPRIPMALMSLELGQGKGGKQMETWFQRAMVADTNCYDACYTKLNYLEPKWYGSEKEMLAFGHECADSEAWGGSVPLILAEAHSRIATYHQKAGGKDYFHSSKVWKDIKMCFEKFFARYPDAIGWRHNYARYAYRCQQWEALRTQIGLMGPINYKFFGGRDAYDEMLEQLDQHLPAKAK